MAKEKEVPKPAYDVSRWKLGDVRCANKETAQLLEIAPCPEIAAHASAYPLRGRVGRHNTLWDANGKNVNNPAHDLVS